jgi:cytochrome-b5 reductase
VFANVAEEDILLRDELEALQYLHPNFNVYYTLDKPPAGWKQGKGFVSPEMIKAILPEPSEQSLVLVCGPKGLMEHVSGNKGPKNTQGEVGGLLKELGYTSEMVYKF